MMNDRNRVFTNEERAAIKAAITAHPQWDRYRADVLGGRDSSTLRKGEIFDAADAFELDLAAVVANLPAPTEPAMAQTGAGNVVQPAEHVGAFSADDVLSAALAPLAPASGFLSSSLLDELKANIMPLAKAFVAPPKTVIKTVRTNDDGTADESMPEAVHIGDETARRVFGVIKSGMGAALARLVDATVPVYRTADAPNVDPHYVWAGDMLAALILAARTGKHVWLGGPAGTGKTSAARQFAAQTGRPFVRIAFDRSTEAVELVGQRLPAKGGGTVWHDGLLTAAMRRPGCVILLDEPTLLRPGALAVLQTVLDHNRITLKENAGEVVDLAPGAMIIAADNTMGCGDETGRYGDTGPINLATLDRFAWIVAADYLPEDKEAQTLSAQTRVPYDAARHVVAFAGQTRKGAGLGTLTAGISLRRLLAWCEAMREGVPSRVAFQFAVMAGTDAADRETIKQIANANVQHDMLDKLVHGSAIDEGTVTLVETGVTMTAEGARAASMFANA